MDIEKEIQSAASRLREGEVVAFPTETVYGLGANALDPIAVAKVFELKGRPRFDPLIVHVLESSWLEGLVESIPLKAMDLIAAFWPGPLSLVLNKTSVIPDIVTAGLQSVAVRSPRHEIARKLIQSADVPVAAPSANRFGQVSPTTANHVIEQFGDQVKVLDGGPCSVGVESTVVSFADSPDQRPRILRPGGITREEIEAITGKLELNFDADEKPTSQAN